MIDSVSMSTQIYIPKEEFTRFLWGELSANGDFELSYIHKENGVTIKYFPNTHTLRISGKIIRLVSDSNISNFDDVYGTDRETFISDVNEKINRLFNTVTVDIRDFNVSRIDYCFNIYTPYTKEYLDFLTKAFNAVNKGARKNFAYEQDLHDSVYVKTKADYDNARKTNYALNFYDKEDWLRNRSEDISFSDEDIALAQNIFRLEVQAYSKLITHIQKKHGISRSFGELFHYEVAQYAISYVYKQVFGAAVEQDFYKYATAKQLARTETMKKTLERSAEHHAINIAKYGYAVRKIKEKGIYPFYFLPKDFELDILPNPLWLIKDKIQQIQDQS